MKQHKFWAWATIIWFFDNVYGLQEKVTFGEWIK